VEQQSEAVLKVIKGQEIVVIRRFDTKGSNIINLLIDYIKDKVEKTPESR